MKRLIAAAGLALAGCSGGQQNAVQTPPEPLEQAAIERGLVHDPKDSEISGLYARDTDRLCIVPDGYGYRIGAYVDYGPGLSCSGTGSVSRVGEALHIDLGGGQGCSFQARIDGERVVFPAQLPDGCAKLCSGRASYSALEVDRMSDAVSEAEALRDPKGRRLCAGAK